MSDSSYLLVCEVALGNVCNTTQGVPDQKDVLEGYHSLRVMGRRGPIFSSNLVRPDNNIWPMGKITNYEEPIYREHHKEFRSYDALEKFEEKGTKKEETKGKGRSTSRKKRKMKKDDSDVEMIDTRGNEVEAKADDNSDKKKVYVKKQEKVKKHILYLHSVLEIMN